MPPDITIRPYRPGDAPALAALYRDAVLTIGGQAYDARQVAVWSAWPESDLEAFHHLLSQGLTLVAEQAGHPVAFGQLDPPDHIALLYTAGGRNRRGTGTHLYQALEDHALSRGTTCLHTEASRIARPFFLKQGFVVVATEWPVRQGVTFERFRMEKPLTSSVAGGQGP